MPARYCRVCHKPTGSYYYCRDHVPKRIADADAPPIQQRLTVLEERVERIARRLVAIDAVLVEAGLEPPKQTG